MKLLNDWQIINRILALSVFRINKKRIYKASVQLTDIFFHPERKKIQVFIFCILGATLLWFLNALSKDRTEVINYPIQFQYNQKKYTAMQEFPKDIPLNVKGSGWQIMKKVLRIRITPIQYRINAPLNAPKYILGTSLKADITKILDDVVLEDILIDTIFIDLDQRIDKTFRIAVDSSRISFKKGFRLTKPVSVFPNKVALNGPKRILTALPDPLPITLNTRQIQERITERVDLSIDHPNADLIHKDVKTIKVSLTPTPFMTKSSSLIIEVANIPPGLPYFLRRDQRITEVTYTFAVEDQEKIRPSDFKIFADFRTFRAADTTVALVLKHKPDFIKNQDIRFKPRIKLAYDRK